MTPQEPKSAIERLEAIVDSRQMQIDSANEQFGPKRLGFQQFCQETTELRAIIAEIKKRDEAVRKVAWAMCRWTEDRPTMEEINRQRDALFDVVPVVDVNAAPLSARLREALDE